MNTLKQQLTSLITNKGVRGYLTEQGWRFSGKTCDGFDEWMLVSECGVDDTAYLDPDHSDYNVNEIINQLEGSYDETTTEIILGMLRHEPTQRAREAYELLNGLMMWLGRVSK